MTKPRRLDTDRRRQFALKCWAAENLKAARLSPKEGLPLSFRAAAKELKTDPQYLQSIEVGRFLPRFNKALRLEKWIRARLGMDTVATS